ncbi:hypothetical protein RB595_006098 [Gaeumannomyces hyphopodioides]
MSEEAIQSRLEAELAHFNSIPWCSELLRSTPNIVVGLGHGIRAASDGKSSPFFSQTINTPSTIPAFIHFHSWPPPLAPGAADQQQRRGGGSKPGAGLLPIREVRALLSLAGGVDGHEGVCHGGVVCSILDEAIGLLALVNKKVGGLPELPLVTGHLNVRFRRPVRTGRAVLATSRVKDDGDGTGRYACEGVLQDEEGTVLAVGEALFVQLQQIKL